MKNLLLFLFLFPFLASAGKSYNLVVKVVDDKTNEPIEGATVILNEPNKRAVTTNIEGIVIFQNCTSSWLTFEVSLDGYYSVLGSSYSKKAKEDQRHKIRLVDTTGPNITVKKLAEMDKIRAGYSEIWETEMQKRINETARIDTNAIGPCVPNTTGTVVTNLDAEFPGGVEELQKYIVNSIEYPEYAIDNDEQGRVFLSFIVHEDGTIDQIEVVRGASETLNTEAIRVAIGMPKWIPGFCNGRPVKTKSTLPIVFTLN